MKLKDALNEKGNPYWIPDCSRNDLPAFFKELGFKKGAEVGVFEGTFLRDFCAVGLDMYGIDPWTEENRNTMRAKSDTMEQVYQTAANTVSEYPNCVLIKKTSMEAVKDFENESLDFVYIDADHTFGHVAMDLMIWMPKVRKGGIISGHDYTGNARQMKHFAHTGDAVDAFAKSYGFTNWYVVGGKERIRGERRDKALSFFIIK